MKLLILIFACLSLSGCLSANVTGFGILAFDPGIRVYKSEKTTYVTITHVEGEEQPNYSEIAELLKGVFTEDCYVKD